MYKSTNMRLEHNKNLTEHYNTYEIFKKYFQNIFLK